MEAVALTDGERQKAEALYREFMESQQALRRAEKNWMDYQYQLATDHVPDKWNGNGLAFTPDFRFAVPR